MNFAAATVALVFLAGTAPTAPPAERTHPVVRPAAGGQDRVFTLRFTERQEPRDEGGLSFTYQVSVGRPGGGPDSCLPESPEPISKGAAGLRRAVRLHPPAGGWCPGRYTATVYLVHRPACQGPPSPTLRRQTVACPLYIALTDTGHAGFRVRR